MKYSWFIFSNFIKVQTAGVRVHDNYYRENL